MIRVHFVPQVATPVRIIGAVNAGPPKATPMVVLSNGRWIKAMVLAPGVYEYRLVADGSATPAPPPTKRSPAGAADKIPPKRGAIPEE